MRPLELDFERPRRPSRATQAVLLAIALAFAGDVAWNHLQTREELRSVRERLAQRPVQSSSERSLIKVAAQPVNEEEYAFARETIGHLSTPWNALFQALEAARIDSIAIVSVEPDPAARTVTVRGEAKNYLAALSFVANLREQRALRDVYLVRHESSAIEPRLPMQFSVTASWSGRS
jgi:hypothetical protein